MCTFKAILAQRLILFLEMVRNKNVSSIGANPTMRLGREHPANTRNKIRIFCLLFP